MKTILIIGAVAILLIVTLIALFFTKKRRGLRYQKNINKRWREEQNEKNTQWVSKLILGNHLTISRKRKRKSIRAFDRWQKKENGFWDTASKEQSDLLVEYMTDKKDKFSFTPLIQEENPCKKSKGYPDGYELFLKNAFTDPFPSLHDMPEWAISNKLTELFVVHSICPEDSRCYLFHLKRYYVNHEMTQAIIQFDLWKIPDPKITSRFSNRAKQFAEGIGDW